MSNLGRRKFILYSSAALGSSILLKACGQPTETPENPDSGNTGSTPSGDTIKVGILHSLSGTMAISEISLRDMELMAIENGAAIIAGEMPIEELGVTAIWQTPPVLNQWWSTPYSAAGWHGYWAVNFKEVDPHFGTLDSYRELSHQLHCNGMYLLTHPFQRFSPRSLNFRQCIAVAVGFRFQ